MVQLISHLVSSKVLYTTQRNRTQKHMSVRLISQWCTSKESHEATPGKGLHREQGGSLKKYRTLAVQMSVSQNIELCIVPYYYHICTGQRANIPDSPVKYRTSGNPIIYRCCESQSVETTELKAVDW